MSDDDVGMRVGELWRYPGKSMRGERLEAAELLADGIAGDRVVHVEDEHDRLVTARTGQPARPVHRHHLRSRHRRPGRRSTAQHP